MISFIKSLIPHLIKQFYWDHPDASIGGFFLVFVTVLAWFLNRFFGKKDPPPKPTQEVNQEEVTISGDQSIIQGSNNVTVDQQKDQSINIEN